jgi:hypothetical protein
MGDACTIQRVSIQPLGTALQRMTGGGMLVVPVVAANGRGGRSAIVGI